MCGGELRQMPEDNLVRLKAHLLLARWWSFGGQKKSAEPLRLFMTDSATRRKNDKWVCCRWDGCGVSVSLQSKTRE